MPKLLTNMHDSRLGVMFHRQRPEELSVCVLEVL
jgi:hypothetical protein